MATPIRKTQGEAQFDVIANWSESKQNPASMTLQKLSDSSTEIENIMREQVTSISDLIDNAVVCLFVHTGRAL